MGGEKGARVSSASSDENTYNTTAQFAVPPHPTAAGSYLPTQMLTRPTHWPSRLLGGPKACWTQRSCSMKTLL